MLKKFNLSTFLLTKGLEEIYYSITELNFLIENLSKYKFNGIVVINVEDFNEDYIVMMDEGLIVSVIFMGFEFEEIAPIILKNRYGEKNKVFVYTMPANYSEILRVFYKFENIIINNVIGSKRDWDNLISVLSKQNLTGLLNLSYNNQQYFILVKKGNLILRNEMLNNNNLITSFYYYKEILQEEILKNNRIVVNFFGIEDKKMEKIIEDNEKLHMGVKELEIKGISQLFLGPPTIRLSKLLLDEWYRIFQTIPKMIKIDGYNEKLNAKIEFDEKVEADSVYISDSLLKRIKIRNKSIDKGDKIIIVPQLE